MTPKEKALELYTLYYDRIEHTLSEDYSPHEKEIIKSCALIAVDEIIFLVSYDDIYFWDQVKIEIENL